MLVVIDGSSYMMGVGGVAAAVMNDGSEVGIALEMVVALVLRCVMVVVIVVSTISSIKSFIRIGIL